MQKNETLKLFGDESDEYIALNAKSKLFEKGIDNFKQDKKAAKVYVKKHVLPNTKKFKNFEQRFHFLVDNNYYEEQFLNKYNLEQIKELTKYAYSFNRE